MKRVSGKMLLDNLGVDYFQNAAVFGAMSSEAIAFLLSKANVYQTNKDDVIYEPGDKGDCFYIVLKGTVSLYQRHLGESAYIRDHKFGEELGFVAMIALHDRFATAIATEEGYLAEIPFDLFNDLHQEHPKQFGLMLMNLSREMARTITEVSNTIVEHKISRRMLD